MSRRSCGGAGRPEAARTPDAWAASSCALLVPTETARRARPSRPIAVRDCSPIRRPVSSTSSYR